MASDKSYFANTHDHTVTSLRARPIFSSVIENLSIGFSVYSSCSFKRLRYLTVTGLKIVLVLFYSQFCIRHVQKNRFLHVAKLMSIL